MFVSDDSSNQPGIARNRCNSSSYAAAAAGHPVQEAAAIVAEIKRLHKEDGVPYENMACLFRVFNPM